MRKQYQSRHVGADRHVWDVHRIVRLSREHPVTRVPLTSIAELDENWWYDDPPALPAPRSLADHMALVESCDLENPLILCAEGRLKGMQRAVKALLTGRDLIEVVRFPGTPEPDFVNVPLSDLPYPDENV